MLNIEIQADVQEIKPNSFSKKLLNLKLFEKLLINLNFYLVIFKGFFLTIILKYIILYYF